VITAIIEYIIYGNRQGLGEEGGGGGLLEFEIYLKGYCPHLFEKPLSKGDKQYCSIFYSPTGGTDTHVNEPWGK